MSLLRDSITAYSEYDNKDLIILCDEKRTVRTKTFKEIVLLSQLIIGDLSKQFSDKAECVGLLMTHNLYLPSIIIRYVYRNS